MKYFPILLLLLKHMDGCSVHEDHDEKTESLSPSVNMNIDLDTSIIPTISINKNESYPSFYPSYINNPSSFPIIISNYPTYYKYYISRHPSKSPIKKNMKKMKMMHKS